MAVQKQSKSNEMPETKTVSKAESALVEVVQYDVLSNKKDTISIRKSVFGQPVKKQILAQYVHVFLTNQRQGNAMAKTRGEVVGSTRKIYRQKGTGGARHGSKKAPIFVGGGVTHGPRPRDFDLKINSKVAKKALHLSLSDKVKAKSLIVLKDVNSIKPKTKEVVSILKNLDINDKKSTLIVYSEGAKNMLLAGRNLKNIAIKNVRQVNAYDVIRSHVILLDNESINYLQS